MRGFDDDADYYRGGLASEMMQAYSEANGGEHLNLLGHRIDVIEKRIDGIPRETVARALLKPLPNAPDCPWIIDTLQFLEPGVAGRKIK